MNHKYNMKKSLVIALLCSAMTGSIFLSACNTADTQTSSTNSESTQSSQTAQNSVPVQNSVSESNTNQETSNSILTATVAFDDEDKTSIWDENNSTKVTLDKNSINVSGNGTSVSGTTLTISSAGTYIISGTLDDGQIVISAGKNDVVKLVLNNASISSSTAPAIYAEKAQKTIIILADGTTNTLSDGSNYYTESSETSTETDTSSSPNAAIFCQDDLTITGNGTLDVVGNAHNGITSKDILRISSGTINVNAANNGITGRDSLAIIGGNITVTALGDGIRSTYAETDDSSKGHISIENVVINITSGEDGIQAEKNLIVNSGTITITTGGGSEGVIHTTANDFGGRFGSMQPTAEDSSTVSRKAVKAGSEFSVNDGIFTINSYDDSIHCNGTVNINGGTFDISAGDDAVHADDTLSIQNGNIKVSSSYEGLEANIINISGGTIDITASDDGLNAAGGNDSSGFGGGRPQDNFSNTSGNIAQLNISGGTLYVTANGDGVDSNAAITISGGTTVVNGTTSSGNGIIDHDGECKIIGGTLIGSGTSGMLEMPDSTSTQNSVAVTLSTSQQSNTLVYITDTDGNILTAMSPVKNFNCIVFSSSLLKTGGTYYVYIGGTANGESVNGYYSQADVSGGTKYTEFTISDVVTYVNENGITGSGGMGGNMGGYGGMGKPNMRGYTV